jgi:hypothetical protein
VVKRRKISNHIAPISIDEIRVVDEDLAHLLGEKWARTLEVKWNLERFVFKGK